MRKEILLSAAAATFALACNDADRASGEAPTGTLIAALDADAPVHDVAGVYYRVVGADEDCDAEPIAEDTVDLEEEYLPVWLDPDGAGGDRHPFADALFILQPGAYKVCVTPITADGEPSAECAGAEALADVIAEETNEIVIMLQCEGDPSGGLDVIVGLNDPPHIDDLDIEPSKFITVCEDGTITVTASDPNGDELSYEWNVLEGPGEGNIAGDGPQVVFTADTPGDYLVEVIVSDGHGGTARLTFPMHVSDEECEPELARVATLDLNPIAQALIDRGFAVDAYGYDGDYSWMTTENYDLLFLGRYAYRWDVVTPELIEALEAYSLAGGNIITEWDGLSLMGVGYDQNYRYTAGAAAPMGWFQILVGAGQFLNTDTPVTVTEPGDRIFAGVGSPITAGPATEFFFTIRPSNLEFPNTGLEMLATFPGDGSPNFPEGDLGTIYRGARCGGNIVMITFDMQDQPDNPAFDPFLFNLLGEGVAPVPMGVQDVCP